MNPVDIIAAAGLSDAVQVNMAPGSRVARIQILDPDAQSEVRQALGRRFKTKRTAYGFDAMVDASDDDASEDLQPRDSTDKVAEWQKHIQQYASAAGYRKAAKQNPQKFALMLAQQFASLAERTGAPQLRRLAKRLQVAAKSEAKARTILQELSSDLSSSGKPRPTLQRPEDVGQPPIQTTPAAESSQPAAPRTQEPASPAISGPTRLRSHRRKANQMLEDAVNFLRQYLSETSMDADDIAANPEIKEGWLRQLSMQGLDTLGPKSDVIWEQAIKQVGHEMRHEDPGYTGPDGMEIEMDVAGNAAPGGDWASKMIPPVNADLRLNERRPSQARASRAANRDLLVKLVEQCIEHYVTEGDKHPSKITMQDVEAFMDEETDLVLAEEVYEAIRKLMRPKRHDNEASLKLAHDAKEIGRVQGPKGDWWVLLLDPSEERIIVVDLFAGKDSPLPDPGPKNTLKGLNHVIPLDQKAGERALIELHGDPAVPQWIKNKAEALHSQHRRMKSKEASQKRKLKAHREQWLKDNGWSVSEKGVWTHKDIEGPQTIQSAWHQMMKTDGKKVKQPTNAARLSREAQDRKFWLDPQTRSVNDPSVQQMKLPQGQQPGAMVDQAAPTREQHMQQTPEQQGWGQSPWHQQPWSQPENIMQAIQKRNRGEQLTQEEETALYYAQRAKPELFRQASRAARIPWLASRTADWMTWDNLNPLSEANVVGYPPQWTVPLKMLGFMAGGVIDLAKLAAQGGLRGLQSLFQQHADKIEAETGMSAGEAFQKSREMIDAQKARAASARTPLEQKISTKLAAEDAWREGRLACPGSCGCGSFPSDESELENMIAVDGPIPEELDGMADPVFLPEQGPILLVIREASPVRVAHALAEVGGKIGPEVFAKAYRQIWATLYGRHAGSTRPLNKAFALQMTTKGPVLVRRKVASKPRTASRKADRPTYYDLTEIGQKLGMKPRYVSKYLTGRDGAPHLGKGIRTKGEGEDIKVRVDDVEEFVKRIREFRSPRGASRKAFDPEQQKQQMLQQLQQMESQMSPEEFGRCDHVVTAVANLMAGKPTTKDQMVLTYVMQTNPQVLGDSRGEVERRMVGASKEANTVNGLKIRKVKHKKKPEGLPRKADQDLPEPTTDEIIEEVRERQLAVPEESKEEWLGALNDARDGTDKTINKWEDLEKLPPGDLQSLKRKLDKIHPPEETVAIPG